MTSMWRTSGWILVGSALILALSLGVRHGFGLFLAPMSAEFGWGRGTFALAIALQNLMWGLAQPFAGALADRFGATKVVFVGGCCTPWASVFMGLSDSAWSLSLSAGLLIGIGLSGTSFSVILGVVGRAVAPEKRSMAMGIASAAGSFGQFAMVPGTLGLISWLGWSAALLALGLMVALIVPLVGMLKDRPLPDGRAADLAVRRCTKPAATPGSGCWPLAFSSVVSRWCLSACTCRPTLVDQHLPATTRHHGAGADRPVQYRRHLHRRLARWAYVQTALVHRVVSAAGRGDRLFLWAPVTQVSAYLFGMAMGLLWLSTVPLTNGTVATLFGVPKSVDAWRDRVSCSIRWVPSLAVGWAGWSMIEPVTTI